MLTQKDIKIISENSNLESCTYLRLPSKGKKLMASEQSLSIDELPNPIPGKWYDSIFVKKFCLDSENTLHLNTGMTLKATSKVIKYEAAIVKADQPSVIISELNDMEIHNKAAAEFDFTHSMDGQYKVPLLACIRLTYFDDRDNEQELALGVPLERNMTDYADYEHICPKKEPVTRYLGETTKVPPEGGGAQRLEGTTENVVISLFREPKNRDDCDYICFFGKDKNNRYPYIGIPFECKIKLKEGYELAEPLEITKAVLKKVGRKGGGATPLVYSMQDKVYTLSKEYGKEGDTFISITADDSWGAPYKEVGGEKPIDYDLEFYMRFIVKHHHGKVTVSDGDIAVTSDKTVTGCLYNAMNKITLLWGCIQEDAKITMADGSYRTINQMEIGEYCYNLNDSQGCKVRNIWRGPGEKCIKLTYDSESLIMTPDHPVCVGQGWTRARKVRVGDKLRGEGNTMYTVSKVELVEYNNMVYNLDIDSEMYYANGILVGDMRLQNNMAEEE